MISELELHFLAGFADGLAGTVKGRSPDEARYIGEYMVRLVEEVSRLSGIELVQPRGVDAGE